MSQAKGTSQAAPLPTVLVLGGSGFVGRHAVDALLSAGAHVVIGSRTPAAIAGRLSKTAQACQRRQLRFETLTESEVWRPLIADVDAVLNCVGILRQVGQATYDRVHHLAPTALAIACEQQQTRFVHVSALGLHRSARSRFLSSKLVGEQSIRSTPADWVIARPSLLDGEGGYGARWLRGVAQLPLFFAPMDAVGQIAALHVADLGEALARLCLGSSTELRLDESREFDLGGPDLFLFRDYIRALRTAQSPRSAMCVPVPGLFARLFAHACDLVHFSPFSFGHWELLRRDNKPQVNRLAELLRRPPRVVAQDPFAGNP